MGTLIRYILIVVGFTIILQFLEVDLNALTIIASALGVGVGSDLQNITTNIVSGIRILCERPNKVGDRIEVGSVSGYVLKISIKLIFYKHPPFTFAQTV